MALDLQRMRASSMYSYAQFSIKRPRGRVKKQRANRTELYMDGNLPGAPPAPPGRLWLRAFLPVEVCGLIETKPGIRSKKVGRSCGRQTEAEVAATAEPLHATKSPAATGWRNPVVAGLERQCQKFRASSTWRSRPV